MFPCHSSKHTEDITNRLGTWSAPASAYVAGAVSKSFTMGYVDLILDGYVGG